MDLFEKICLGTVTVCAGVLLIEGALFVREARLDTDKITGEVAGWNRGVWNVLGDTSSAMTLLAQIGAKERNDFDAQQAYYKDLSSKTGTLLDSANKTVNTFNDMILPRVADTLEASEALETSAARNLTDTSAKIDDTIDALRPMIDGGIRATTAAAAAMADPAIHETLDHFDATAGNLEGMSADGKRITGDASAYVHRLTRPARGSWAFVRWILGLTRDVRQATGY